MHAGQHVTVDRERDRHKGMPEYLTHLLGMDAFQQ